MIKKTLYAKDKNIRIAKGIIIGFIFSILISYLTSETKYYRFVSGKKIDIISSEKYNDNSYYYSKYVKDTRYNSLFIILGFITGTAMGYLLINEKKV
ncbi:hypothetical protein [Tenacibaculum ovolyticum]|uniref:hypothetical protein n=1 Tax=Tenacibaculum ovolyticum TaxID=104270 RepID=UPI001F2EAFB0|nr:hypothetical protein [Tenacibaculum ovolyticum]